MGNDLERMDEAFGWEHPDLHRPNYETDDWAAKCELFSWKQLYDTALIGMNAVSWLIRSIVDQSAWLMMIADNPDRKRYKGTKYATPLPGIVYKSWR